jgi:hypothetical protein|tara:strand:- start:2765 stop:3058 length:294 start_codon:yes stop_codon:yes gene_type:complete
MNRNEPKPLKAAIEQFVKAYRMQNRLDEVDTVNAWNACFGKMVQRQTRSIRLQAKGKLWVKLNSGPLKEELMMSKGKMVERLNEHLGRKIISEVIIQ